MTHAGTLTHRYPYAQCQTANRPAARQQKSAKTILLNIADMLHAPARHQPSEPDTHRHRDTSRPNASTPDRTGTTRRGLP